MKNTSKCHVKKDDKVKVVTGKDKGKIGKVLKVFHKKQRVMVENVNMVKRHTRPNPQKKIQGGIVEREAPMHISNVMLYDPDAKKPTRVGMRQLDSLDRIFLLVACFIFVFGLRSIIRFAKRSMVTSSFESESLNWYSSSRSEYKGLFITAMAPIFNMP